MAIQKIKIMQTDNGGWLAFNLATKQSTQHYIRKTKQGAIGHAKRLWGENIEIIVS